MGSRMPRTVRRQLVRRAPAALLLPLVAGAAIACAEPHIRRTARRAPNAAQMAELWIEPANIAARDLFWGSGGRALAPANGSTFKFKEQDTSGFSPGFTVE